jgi:hypothetical protein
VGVDLGRGKSPVAQQFLDLADVGLAFQQMGCAGMTTIYPKT